MEAELSRRHRNHKALTAAVVDCELGEQWNVGNLPTKNMSAAVPFDSIEMA